ncbi:hypothetical protein [Brachybacterium sp.]|uniref:hypothetical protein n=1 Tax=Brachybacterium sp. TaxID=1891286 RepID=UPI002ED12621
MAGAEACDRTWFRPEVLAVVEVELVGLDVDITVYQQICGEGRIAAMLSADNARTVLDQSVSGTWS